MVEQLKKLTVLRHPLSAIGASILLAGVVLFAVLMLVDLTASNENPYRSLVTFVISPMIMAMGIGLMIISMLIQKRKARKAGDPVIFRLSIDPTDPHYRKNLWRFLGLSIALITIVVYIGTRAHEATDSVGFCGETCHEVMEPQNVTYHNSAHARVACVECHIGPGASFWVKAKLDGMRQLFATSMDTYARPIETPVSSLRPAQATCEGCHWPQQFYGDKFITHTYYRTDEENSPWTVNLLMKIGGGNPRTGALEGIHWHMLTANKIEYIATDPKREEIPWVRLVNQHGDTVVFTDPDAEIPDPDDPLTEVRTFDCMDCHNRPSHAFMPPAKALNLALSTKRISTDLPYIRQVGLDLLNAYYEDRHEASTAIGKGLYDYYREEYKDKYQGLLPLIDEATAELKVIYSRNFFPEMKTDYRERTNNLSHFVNDGCFRCHDGIKQDVAGRTLPNDCKTCHLIVTQGPSEDLSELTSDITGLDFKHPEDIDEAWKEAKCTECHTPESGY